MRRRRPTRRGGVTIDGLSEVDAALKQLSMSMQRTVLRRALMASAAPLAEAMRSYAPSRSGTLIDSIAIGAFSTTSGQAGRAAFAEAMKADKSRSEAQAALRAANKANAGKFSAVVSVGPEADEAPHAHLVEFGTVERFHKSGKSVGVMPADPFVRPAWDTQKAAVMSSLQQHLADEIDKAVARAAKRKAAKAARGASA